MSDRKKTGNTVKKRNALHKRRDMECNLPVFRNQYSAS
jgi:hypothetical protein